MKNIAIINTGACGSTGKIAKNLYSDLKAKGYNVKFCFGHGTDEGCQDFYVIDKKVERYWHSFMSRVWGKQGTHSYFATRRLIKKLKDQYIDTVILLSLHGNYLNQPLLFKYLSEENILTFYLMIDEYPYVGKCTGTEGCTKFKQGCGNCKALKLHTPTLFFDWSAELYKMKQTNYDKVPRIAFAGPEFVINQAKLSPMMKNRKLYVLDEAINTTIYQPQPTAELKKQLGISEDKIVIVTATSDLPPYKGAEYFDKVAGLLEADDRFIFVRIANDRQGLEHRSKNLIIRGYVEELKEMAVYFSMADKFFFPSLQDTMSNTCLEALACGSPLMCFNISGNPYLGNEEVLTLVEPKNVKEAAEKIKETNKKTPEDIQKYRNYALSRFDSRDYCDRVIDIIKKYE